MKNVEKFSEKEICYALFGTILGDSWVKNYKTTAWIKISHTEKQKEYVNFFKNLAEVWGLKSTKIYQYVQETNYGTYKYYSCNIKLPTKRHFGLERTYKDGKKIVSPYVLNRISVFGLLLWYLDDGSLTVHTKKNGSVSRSASIATHSFTYNENLAIQRMFKDRFDIDVSVNRDKTYNYIYINAENFRKFIDIVRPYLKLVPKDMMYKFNMKYVKNRLKDSELLVANYNF